MLGEPSNDVDTDMLAAMEDVLDSWPGTLIVVSHDRYLLERITDQQYAILPGPDGAGRLRHLPGGVDEYLRLRDAGAGSPGGVRPLSASRGPAAVSGALPSAGSGDATTAGATASRPPAPPTLTGAAAHAARKELAATERKLERLNGDVAALHAHMAEHDQSDYEGLARLTEELGALQEQVDALEERWLELSDLVG